MIDFAQTTSYNDLGFDDLVTTCQACQKCGLAEGRNQVVVGTGPVPANVMIVGEGPGAQEDEQGKPFVGRAGQLLTKILSSVDINRDTDVYITNIVKCRPPQNRAPHHDEVEQCQDYLVRQVQLVQPKLMVLLGSPATKTVLGPQHTISKVRGTWFKLEVPYMDEQLYVMPMFHPSYLLRQDSKEKGSPKWLTWQDMRELKAAMQFYEVVEHA